MADASHIAGGSLDGAPASPSHGTDALQHVRASRRKFREPVVVGGNLLIWNSAKTSAIAVSASDLDPAEWFSKASEDPSESFIPITAASGLADKCDLLVLRFPFLGSSKGLIVCNRQRASNSCTIYPTSTLSQVSATYNSRN